MTETTKPTIKRGDSGPAVVELQRLLLGLVADGIFGAKTEAAVRRFQERRGMPATGIADAATWAALLPKSAAAPAPAPQAVLAGDLEGVRFVQAKSYRAAGRSAVDLVVIHTMEASKTLRTAENVAAWFAGKSAPEASAHYCLVPETRVLLRNLQWVPIGSLREGDVLVATEELAPGRAGRSVQESFVTRLARRETECVRLLFADGREVTCSTDHRWLGRQREQTGSWEWLDSRWLKPGSELCAPLSPWSRREDRVAGYLEGLLDGEGTWTAAQEVSFSQKEGPVLRHALGLLRELGVPFRMHHRRESGVTIVTLSGLQATLRALGEIGSRRLACEDRWMGRALRSRTYDNALLVSEVEHVGVREVVSIETSTHTFFAEGIVSHNCVDADSIVQCVLERDVAHHAPGANRTGIGVELAGYARQTPADWEDEYNAAMLARAAELVAGICARWSIPVVHLTPAELAAGGRGIVGHADCTAAFKTRGGHMDPGPNFPWSTFLEAVRAAMPSP